MRRLAPLLATLAVAGALVANGLARPAVPAPYTLTGPRAETSAWPTPAAGFTWSGGAGSVTVKYQTSTYSGGKPNTATMTWRLPSAIGPDGAKGSLTLHASAGSEVWAPGFSVNGVLVGCTGITNTPSYGTGCADGDHAAIATSLQPGASASVTQEFLVKPGVGTVTVVLPGFAQQFVYTAKASRASAPTTTPATTTDGGFIRVHYVVAGVYSHLQNALHITGLELRVSGSFEVPRTAHGEVSGNRGSGLAHFVLHRKEGTNTIELREESRRYTPSLARVQVVYQVTRSTLPCLPVRSSLEIDAVDGGHGQADQINFDFCGVKPAEFANREEHVAITP